MWRLNELAEAANRIVPPRENPYGDAHGDLVRMLDESRLMKPPLYCEMLTHNPCTDCTLGTTGCGSANANSTPRGLAAEGARLVLRMLGYLRAQGADMDAAVKAVMADEDGKIRIARREKELEEMGAEFGAWMERLRPETDEAEGEGAGDPLEAG